MKHPNVVRNARRGYATMILSLSLLLFPLMAVAGNLDSLLSNLVNVPKPYLIVNFASTDCIMCRAVGVSILKNLENNTPKSKIVLVTDDKNMASYFTDNTELFSGYTLIVSKSLSNGIGISAFSTACLVQNDGVHPVIFSKVDADTIAFFKSALHSEKLAIQQPQTLRDTAFTNVSDLTWLGNNEILFNYRFQLGSVCNGAQVTYAKPLISDKALNVLYCHASKFNSHKPIMAPKARKTLSMFGLPIITTEAIGDNAMIVKATAESNDTTISGTDTTINQNVFGNVFLATGRKKESDVFNIDNYTDFTYLDSIHDNGNTYWPNPHLGIKEHDGSYYIAYTDYTHSRKNKEAGKEYTVPTATVIVKFTGNKEGKASKKQMFEIPDYDGQGGLLFFFNVTDQGAPFYVNNDTRKIVTNNGKTSISFDMLSADIIKVKEIYDASMSGGIMHLTGIFENGLCFTGTYNPTSETATLNTVDEKPAFQNMRLRGNSVLGCRKNNETNELEFRELVFK